MIPRVRRLFSSRHQRNSVIAHLGLIHYNLSQSNIKVWDPRYDDLYSEGLDALLQAVLNWNPDGKAEWATYACRAILERIYRKPSLVCGNNPLGSKFVSPVRDERLEWVIESLGKLEPQYKTVLELYIQGLSQVKIAETIGKTSERAGQLLAESLEALRRLALIEWPELEKSIMSSTNDPVTKRSKVIIADHCAFPHLQPWLDSLKLVYPTI